MSWLRLDDDMLDHPKWVRAIRDGGSAALHLWVALCSWCSRHLTDGVVPADIVPTLTQQLRARDRSKALSALESSQLVASDEPGAIRIVDYLERNPSRAETMALRERRAKAQRDYVDRKKLTGQQPIAHLDDRPPPDTAPSRPVPARPDPRESESAPRALDVRPPEVPGLTVVALPGPARTGPIKASRRETAETALLGARGVARYEYTPGWKPTREVNLARALELGITEAELWERWDQVQDKHYSQAFRSDEKQFNRELAWLVADKRKAGFQSQSKRDREAFELPGRERAIGR